MNVGDAIGYIVAPILWKKSTVLDPVEWADTCLVVPSWQLMWWCELDDRCLRWYEVRGEMTYNHVVTRKHKMKKPLAP